MKVLLVAGPGITSYAVAHALQREFDLQAVIVESPPSRLQLVRRRAKRLGWLTVINQLAFQTVGVAALRLEARKRLRELLESTEFRHKSFGNTVVHQVDSINDSVVPNIIENYSPDVVVVNGTRIISSAILESVNIPFINTHLGITPMYRGVHGGYWALAEGKPEDFGATVHRVDAGVDTGEILAQTPAHPEPGDNFTTYPLNQLRAVLPELIEVVRNTGKPIGGRIDVKAGAGALRYHPTLTGYLVRRLLDKVR